MNLLSVQTEAMHGSPLAALRWEQPFESAYRRRRKVSEWN